MDKNKDSILSKRELDVMNVLWEADKPLMASEIPKANPSLSINTVQAVLKKLLDKKFIQISDIGYSGTVLTRNYVPIVSSDDYAFQYVESEIFPFGKFLSKQHLINTLFDNAENDEKLIEELEELLQKKKKGI